MIMAPSLSHRERQRPLSTISLRSCSETTATMGNTVNNSSCASSNTALKSGTCSDEEMAVRTSASSVHSVTSNRSSRSQQRRTRGKGLASSTYSVTSNRSSRSLGSNGNNNNNNNNNRRFRRPESYSPPGSSLNKASFNNNKDSSKIILLYARIAMLTFILLNLTKLPAYYGVVVMNNQEHIAATTAMKIYSHATQPKLYTTADDALSPSSLVERRTPRFLFGIFSTLRRQDLVRRNVIRRTYLASDPYRICSLQELPQKPDCKIVYTFVVGANVTGRTDLVDDPPPSRLTVDPLQHPILDENGEKIITEEDVTYLNVQENMEYGKSPSWFLYANTLVDDLDVDFIAKVDSDTLVFPNRFLDEFASFLPVKNRYAANHVDDNSTAATIANATKQNPTHQTSELRVYGGIPNDSIGCGGLRRPHCANMGGKTYMQGQLHFLSADLSRYVTSIPREIRRQLFVPIEDLCTAKYVHSHPKPIFEAVVSPQQLLWEHGKHIKDPKSYERRWNEVMQEMQPHSVRRTGSTTSSSSAGGVRQASASRIGLSA